jgi:hypothetical protein
MALAFTKHFIKVVAVKVCRQADAVNGLSSTRLLLLRFGPALIGVAFVIFTACGPGPNDIERITDQGKLSKMAVAAQDSYVRLAAVAALTDRALLTEVALSDGHGDAGKAALAKLATPALLAQIALQAKSPYVRIAAVERLADQPSLARIAAEDSDPDVGQAAAARLTEQTLLTKTAFEAKTPLARFVAMRKLTDQATLAKIAAEDQDAEVRHGALVKLDVAQLVDQPLLAKLAVEAKDSDVRRSALAKLNDSSLLAQMGMWVKPELTRLVTDQALLAKIALQAQDTVVRLAAIASLTNQDLLAKMATQPIDLEFRCAVVEKLTDQAVLAQIALSEEDIRVRRAAVHNLTDQHTLRLIAMKEDALTVLGINLPRLDALSQFIRGEGIAAAEDDAFALRLAAIARMTDQGALAEMVDQLKDPSLRRATVEQLTDQAVLANIAGHNPSQELRIMAISKLTNQSILRSLAQVSPQAAIRQSAVQRITDDQYLLGRLSIEPSAAVRQSIVETLRTQAALQQVALSGYHRDNRDEALNRLRILSPESAGNALAEQKAMDSRAAALRTEEDNSVLLKLALEGELDILRTAAAQRLADAVSIEQVLSKTTNHDVLKLLLPKMRGKESLLRLKAGAADPALRVAAMQASGGQSWRAIFDAATTRGATAETLGNALAAVSLFSSIQSDAKDAVQHACLNLIRLGDELRIPEMAELLEDYGDITLAEDYLNCGQPDLNISSRDWASRHGFRVDKGNGSHRARWASGR